MYVYIYINNVYTCVCVTYFCIKRFSKKEWFNGQRGCKFSVRSNARNRFGQLYWWWTTRPWSEVKGRRYDGGRKNIKKNALVYKCLYNLNLGIRYVTSVRLQSRLIVRLVLSAVYVRSTARAKNGTFTYKSDGFLCGLEEYEQTVTNEYLRIERGRAWKTCTHRRFTSEYTIFIHTFYNIHTYIYIYIIITIYYNIQRIYITS